MQLIYNKKKNEEKEEEKKKNIEINFEYYVHMYVWPFVIYICNNNVWHTHLLYYKKKSLSVM